MTRGWVALLVLAATACAPERPPIVDFSEANRHYRPQDYERVLAKWTRHTRVVADVGTVIEMWATFQSWDFRQAFVEEYTRLYGVSDEERRALDESQRESARRSFEFHVTVQSTDWHWNDLEKDSSSWRVTLLDGTGAEIRPESITIHRLPPPVEEHFFPYRTPFTRSYLIRFDRADATSFAGMTTGRLVLRVAGPLGRADATWQSR